MNDKMMVLFVKNTGHVVAASTRAGDPEGKGSAAALAGTGLPVRRIRKIAPAVADEKALVIRPDSLDVAVVQLDPDVFGSPLSFAAGGGVVGKLGTTAEPTVNLTTTKITVTVPVAPADKLGVWVELEEVAPLPGNDPERRVMEGFIENPNNSVALDLKIRPDGPPASVPSGTNFYILALVAGHQAFFDTQSS